jgi:hypothetical protein
MVSSLLLVTGVALLLASLISLAAFAPDGTRGHVMLTPEGCESVRLAGGTPELRNGVCVASGRYNRQLSGWTYLTLNPRLTVALAPRAMLMTTPDDRIPAPEDARRQRVILIEVGCGILAAVLCFVVSWRIGLRKRPAG